MFIIFEYRLMIFELYAHPRPRYNFQSLRPGPTLGDLGRSLDFCDCIWSIFHGMQRDSFHICK